MSTGFALLVPVSTATGVDRRYPSDAVHLVAIRVYGLQSMFASKSPPQEFIDSWGNHDYLIRFLPQFQWTSPPTQLEFAVPAHAEFVICDCTIEFNFRDAKQFWGLEDFMNIGETQVNNAANLAFFMVNLSRRLLDDFRQSRPKAGVLDLKAFFRGRRYAERTLELLPLPPAPTSIDQIVETVASLGAIHSTDFTNSFDS